MSEQEIQKKKHLSLRTEQDLIEAHEKITNGLLTGEIDAHQASAATRLLKGSQFLIAELPYRKLMLLAKLQSNKVRVPDKLLEAYVGKVAEE